MSATVKLSPRQLEQLADMIAERIADRQDEILSLDAAAKETGFSKSYLYKHWGEMGGLKAGNKIVFSRKNMGMALKYGKR